jgi:phage repressor protein C with HTH and peptisase S24 domain
MPAAYSQAYTSVNRQTDIPPDRVSYILAAMTMGDRIEERLTTLGISQAELARRVKVSQPTINALIRGGSTGSKHLHKIASELETSPAWLVGETDDPSPIAPRTSTVEALAEELDLAILPQFDIGLAMGPGKNLAERYEQTGIVPFARSWLRSMMSGSFGELFVARGDGDSMEPTLKDGDIVLIDSSQQTIRAQDRIWAVVYGDLGMIKRVRRTPAGSYLLMSDNPTVPPVECHDGEMNVIGRVVWIGRRI